MIVHRLSLGQCFYGWPNLKLFASHLLTWLHFSSSDRDTSSPEHLADELRLSAVRFTALHKERPTSYLKTEGPPPSQQ